MEQKWIDIHYHVQGNDVVSQKDVKIYFNTNKFPALLFCGPHSKPHGARGLSKHYHLRFDPKLGSDVCAILRIQCTCFSFKAMMDKHWIYGIPSDKQE